MKKAKVKIDGGILLSIEQWKKYAQSKGIDRGVCVFSDGKRNLRIKANPEHVINGTLKVPRSATHVLWYQDIPSYQASWRFKRSGTEWAMGSFEFFYPSESLLLASRSTHG